MKANNVHVKRMMHCGKLEFGPCLTIKKSSKIDSCTCLFCDNAVVIILLMFLAAEKMVLEQVFIGPNDDIETASITMPPPKSSLFCKQRTNLKEKKQ